MQDQLFSLPCPNLKSIARLLQVVEDSKDTWLAYEVGNVPLSKHMFEVKGEFYHGERLYNVQHKCFYQSLALSPQVIKDFITKMAETLEVMAKRFVVHADIKPDNVLVDFDGKRITGIKLIDFGSAFMFSNEEGSKITASTPEYLAPEVLALLE